jgi:hypothetical protein
MAVLLTPSSADLCGSIDTVQKPFFELPRESPPRSRITLEFHGFHDTIAIDSRLEALLCQVQEVTDYLNFVHMKMYTDEYPLALREDIISIQYVLLTIELDQDGSCCDLANETLRLGLLMYLSTLLSDNFPGASLCDTLCTKFTSAFEKIKLEDGLVPEFQLWILFIGASLADSTETKSYFLTSVLDIIQKLGLFNYQSVERTLKSFFWVKQIHEPSFRSVWTTIGLREPGNADLVSNTHTRGHCISTTC